MRLITALILSMPVISPSVSGAALPSGTGATAQAAAAFVRPRLSASPLHPIAAPASFERSLNATVRRIVKTVHNAPHELRKYLRYCARRWLHWASSAPPFILLALLIPLLDWRLLRTWRQEGFRALRVSATLAVAVYIRLLMDRESSMVGKALLVLAIVYGVVSNDILPDHLLPMGLVDDAIVVILASRLFTSLCADSLIQRHALSATQAWDRMHRAA